MNHDYRRAEPFLETSLLIALVVHFVATVFMAVFLMPAMPGAINADPERVAYIAKHPWLWHIGWFPWHLCALSDIVLAIALLRTKWIPKLPAVITLILTIAAVTVEQPAELKWNAEGPFFAQLCTQVGSLAPYLDFEREMFVLVGAVAAVIYALMAFAWTWCFAAAGTWNRFLSCLSAITWTLLLFTALAPLLPDSTRPSLLVIGIGNGIGFNLMALWFILVLEAVLRRSRIDEEFGRMASWKHPRRDAVGSILTTLANSRFLRYVGEWLPSVALVSDIEDVIYINYLVDADKVESIVPASLELQRLGPAKNYALFSILTYRHGHFGPRILGPLRFLMPSPVQSNWRIHVRDRDSNDGIFFIATVVNSALVSLGARWLSDGVPMHVAESASVTANGAGAYGVELKRGNGSAPDLLANLSVCETPVLSGAWQECFQDFDTFLAYCVPQDRAISFQVWYQRTTRQEINLGIPLTICEPLRGEVQSATVEKLLGAEAKPVCFRVPRVKFALERVFRTDRFTC
jgi:hypothetical protein